MSVDESSQNPTDYNEGDDDDDDDEDGNEDLGSRDDTSMQLFHFSFSVLHSLFVILRTTNMRRVVTKIAKDKREQTSTKPD